MNQLHMCTFKGLQNLPIYVGKMQGYFATQGLDIEITYTAGSLPQLAGLARGAYQLIQTAPDNVINVDNNPAAFGLDPSAAPHVIMLLGGSVGPLSVYTQPDITAVDQLRGTVLGVDNPTSGFALLLQDMLARSGLLLERDYTFTLSGGTSSRLDALATAGLQSWIEQHTDEVTSYISAYLQALRWIYNPNHATEVQRVIESEPTLNLDATIAPGAYAAFADPQAGFGINAKLDDAGLQQVIELRATYGSFSRLDRDLAHYRDLRWYPR
jgi:ABC-type nitrate/sulfonate/bicarbonate transport system substrate-binding protein